MEYFLDSWLVICETMVLQTFEIKMFAMLISLRIEFIFSWLKWLIKSFEIRFSYE